MTQSTTKAKDKSEKQEMGELPSAVGVEAEMATRPTTKAKDKGESQEMGGLPSAVGANAEMATHPTAKDVDSEARSAGRLTTKYSNCRSYHEAFNHSDSTVKAPIDNGLVSNTARPPGFSCAACSHADPSGAHFHRNTKTSTSVPLPPYYHVEMDLWGPMDV